VNENFLEKHLASCILAWATYILPSHPDMILIKREKLFGAPNIYIYIFLSQGFLFFWGGGALWPKILKNPQKRGKMFS
jgi:hypothetical protein